MSIKKILSFFITLLTFSFLGTAQTTTSSLTGVVKTASGAPMAGATITATHVPTGSVYTTITRAAGRYELSNMAPGGPYTIKATFVGSAPQVQNEVYLTLGEASKVDFDLSEASKELTGITISGTRVQQKTGAETTLGKELLENIPTVGRNLSDYMRAVPTFKVNSGSFQDAEGAMSFNGQNVRSNSFYVDGAVNNDVYGLALSGTNGGQTGTSPISIDAIEQFQVSISPFNAALGNFTGGSINAITKSGTNDIHGSAYYIFRNQNMAGKTPTGLKDSAIRYPDFESKTYGATLGGPIIKNKLFYFLSFEQYKNTQPSLFDLSSFLGTKDPAVIQKLKDTIAARTNGFNVGGYENNFNANYSDKISAKLDWSITNKHKLSLAYRYNWAVKENRTQSTPAALRFETTGYQLPSLTHAGTFELKSNLGKYNNRLLVTLTDVEDDRGPLGSGDPIPTVRIQEGSGSFNFGTEANSQFNYLKQTTFNVNDHFKFNLGKHGLTLGAEAETYHAINAFIPNGAGNYVYDSLSGFLNNLAPSTYTVNFPLLPGGEKDSKSNANFKVFKWSSFLNDDIKFSKNLTVTVGVRTDFTKFLTEPIRDPFSDTTLAKLSQYHDLKGAQAGVQPTVPISISPRIGFTYNIPSEKVTIRGGFGWFTGRILYVWPAVMYNNNGYAQGGYTLSSSQNSALRDKVKFRVNPYQPSEIGLTLAESKGTLVVVSDKYRMPKVFRTSLAFDKRVGKGWTFSTEGIFTRNVNDIEYRNINLLPPTLRLANSPDTRNIYPVSVKIPIRANGNNPWSNVFLVSNADNSPKAFSYNFVFSVNKASVKGVNFNFNYTFGESQVINEAQNFTPSSMWGQMETVNGRNNLVLSNSDNSVGHRIFSYISKRFFYAGGKLSTNISFSYTGQSGQPISYVYGGSQLVRDGQSFNDLIYIPTSAQIQTMRFLSNTVSGTTYTEAQQRAALDKYIENNKYLRNHRGDYAERLGSRLPFTNIVDLRIAQGFNIKAGKKRYSAEVIYNMFNFTNFLNRDWGRQWIQDFESIQLIQFAGFVNANTDLTPQFRFDPNFPRDPSILYNRVSNPTYTPRWMSQLEFRVKF